MQSFVVFVLLAVCKLISWAERRINAIAPKLPEEKCIR